MSYYTCCKLVLQSRYHCAAPFSHRGERQADIMAEHTLSDADNSKLSQNQHARSQLPRVRHIE